MSHSRLRSGLLLGLLGLLLAVPASAQQATGRLAPARAFFQERRAAGLTGRLSPGERTQLRAVLTAPPGSLVQPTPPGKGMHRDPSFQGLHPMFQRLQTAGWYRNRGTIRNLQSLASSLPGRLPPRSTPLASVEFLVFDLEASGGDAGKFDPKKRSQFGWDQVIQFGYSVYRGGTKVRSGSFDVRPDVNVQPIVERITGIKARQLAGAPGFERVAEQILTLMQGRVLVGQSALRNDWSWLRSNFARLGVDLPEPQGLILDTHVLSFLKNPTGSSLKDLRARYGVQLEGRAHNAGVDAAATGQVFQSMLREQRVNTLGQAFALQDTAVGIMRQPRPQPSL